MEGLGKYTDDHNFLDCSSQNHFFAIGSCQYGWEIHVDNGQQGIQTEMIIKIIQMTLSEITTKKFYSQYSK